MRPPHSPRDEAWTIYRPESRLRRPAQLLRGLAADLRGGVPLSWRLFQRNLRSLYRQTLLGLFWAFLPPLGQTLIWVILHANRVIQVETSVDYLSFVLSGLVLWHGFIDALLAPLQTVQGSRTLLAKINFPRESLILVSVYEVLFQLAIRSLLLIAVFVFRPIELSWGVVYAPLGMLTLVGFGLSLGLLLLPWGVLYQDVLRFLQLIVPFWMLLTPIVYPPPESGWFRGVLWLNPVAPLLVGTRELLLEGGTTLFWPILITSLSTLPLLLVGLVLYRLSLPILIERMNA